MDWEELFQQQIKEYEDKQGNITLDSSDYGSNLSHSKLQEILDKKGEWKAPRLEGIHILIIILAVIAIAINCMTLAAIRYIRRRLSANQTMMFSLCCADLLTSLGIMAKVITDQVFDMHFVPREQKYAATCSHKIIQALVMTGHNATLLNLLCLAVDHYCAIAKPLTYSLQLSKKTVRILLIMFWFVALLFGFSDFLIPSKLHGWCEHKSEEMSGYCERVFCTVYEPDHLMFCVVFVCLVVMSTMYGGIMWILHSYQRQEYSTASQRKAQRHIRGLITSFIILGLFAVLWLPNCIIDIYATLKVLLHNNLDAFKIHHQVFLYLYALLVLNCICDPVVYAMRMKEIQESLKLLMCFKRPTFSNKRNSFGDALRSRASTTSANIPLKYIKRQYSSNSTNTTVCSGVSGSSMSERYDRPPGMSRKGTITSQGSELTEDTPLSGNMSMSQFEIFGKETETC